MGFYNDVILPRLCHLVMRNRRLAPYRERVIASAERRVLEIGIGSGLNLPFYGLEVREIVGRILDVLEQASASLLQLGEVEAASSTAAPAARRFEFVHDARLRPVLETAFADSGRAFDEGDFTRSLMTSCSILEAIVTDALQHCGSRIADCGSEPSIQSAVRNPQSAMSFESRITAAEKRGLIRGGCARLPPVARAYRDVAESDVEVSVHEAKVVRQVLHVVMRDLDPGR